MKLIEWSLKLCLSLAILTMIGQIHIKGRSLENRYHLGVNSSTFQEAYWAMMTPVTYTYGKFLSLVKKEKTSPMAR